MSAAAATARAACPAGGAHRWATFDHTGFGCHYCSAWVSLPRPRPLVDPLPTGLIVLTYLIGTMA